MPSKDQEVMIGVRLTKSMKKHVQVVAVMSERTVSEIIVTALTRSIGKPPELDAKPTTGSRAKASSAAIQVEAA